MWLQCLNAQAQVNEDKAVGVNTYIGLCHTGMGAINLARMNGQKVIAQDEWLPEAVQLGAETFSWMGQDEIDMTRGGGGAGCAELRAAENARDSTSPLGAAFYNNFGKGVMFWQSNADAACYVNIPDIPSADVYWFSDGNACGSSEGGGKPGVVKENSCRVAANYGWLVQRLRSLVSPSGSKPVMAFVELGCPMANCITPAQIRSATWHTIIAGAMGVEYFSHSFKAGAGAGLCGASAGIHRDCPAVRDALKALDEQIQGLAPVLYAPYLTSGFTANSNVKALAKFSSGKFYVLAGTAGHIGPVPGTFSIPCVGNATATVIGESRTIPVNAGSFTDTFHDPNAIHIYRIDGGSTCGLS